MNQASVNPAAGEEEEDKTEPRGSGFPREDPGNQYLVEAGGCCETQGGEKPEVSISQEVVKIRR